MSKHYLWQFSAPAKYIYHKSLKLNIWKNNFSVLGTEFRILYMPENCFSTGLNIQPWAWTLMFPKWNPKKGKESQ